ncbi:hypothetical protein TRFO_35350 [Tritrichomonas foetus]|uniref:Uncharacterized protein n=1 Tax=Tritrichomonas foetus TaxID=1144522 RepID=A0A1J4JLW0_9EUKA|nr:hypothetical protein TRFO_35350 [Tritrichomonas foetus]|eukprot:OHS98260.1 hypothetical protein TRFO_35350 [Tritrichomonas foetus]
MNVTYDNSIGDSTTKEVIVETGINNTVIFNSEGSSNVFFKPIGEKPKITFSNEKNQNATAGILVQGNKQTTVNINSPMINLNIKGGGSLKLTTENNDVTQFYIQNTTLHNENLYLETDKEVTLDLLSLYQCPQLDTKGNVKINTIKAQQGSTASISNCKIEKEIQVALNATVVLEENVDVSKPILNVSFANNLNTNRPIFNFTNQKTPSPPTKIIFQEGMRNALLANENEENVESKMIITYGISNCKAWNKKVDLTGSIFSSSRCEKVDKNDLQQLVVSSNSAGKKKLGPGAIAGIVIACVVVVAVIAGVTIHVVKKNSLSLGIESTINEDEDSIAI